MATETRKEDGQWAPAPGQSSPPVTVPGDPTPQDIAQDKLYRQLGLTDAEYQRVAAELGRLPNYVEAGIFGVLWSEHCSYKSSKPYLKHFPTTGPQVLQGPGENAGIVDLGDGTAVAFKMESHNHPSAIEPYQGAATGVGGILRDIFTMGARPIAFLDSLRFGPLSEPHTRYLFANVVAGIGGYGNCVGIPTVGGEAVFHSAYTANPLVNAMCVGVLPAAGIVKGQASGVGNPVFVIGARTGRDGIHGATFASAEDPHAKERSAVQVGDPFLGKLLMEASLELIATGAVVGIQDMGAAGLTSSAAEMASRAGGGIEMFLDRVPVRETHMTPYEMMLSESQERMLVVLERGKEDLALTTLHKWGLEIAEIGRVTNDGQLRLWFHDTKVGEMPVRLLVDEAPVYNRPVQASPPLWLPQTAQAENAQFPAESSEGVPESEAAVEQRALTLASPEQWLLRLLADPSIADKSWVFRQYDTTVRASTLVGPGGDAAVVKVSGSRKGVALCTDGNGRYVALNPRRGGAIAVAEAARNLSCVGAKPLALTDCLNFGNPENPGVMYQFAEATAGMTEACQILNTPVVSGNVSFYNQSYGQDILPTPVVGMVGVVDSLDKVVGGAFTCQGAVVVVFGPQDTSLRGSLLANEAVGFPWGDAPALRLEMEASVQSLVRALVDRRLVQAVHDVSEGGLAVTLAEMCIAGGVGLTVALSEPVSSPLGWLYSEGQSRVVAQVSREDLEVVEQLAVAADVPMIVLGETGTPDMTMGDPAEVWWHLPVAQLQQVYREALPKAMATVDGPLPAEFPVRQSDRGERQDLLRVSDEDGRRDLKTGKNQGVRS